MTNQRIKLKKLIRSLLEELISEECGCGMPECSTCHPTSRPTDDVTEMNVTANIDGYQTPFAFDDDDEEGHASKIKDTAEVFDYKTTENERKNSVKISEGRSLYHVFRDHPDLTPRQKIGVTMRHINKTLTEVEKYLDVTSRFKSENKVSSDVYWKTTNKHLSKLDEKIQKISRKIREMR